jgi:uncharacterized delta-60 repeat protein
MLNAANITKTFVHSLFIFCFVCTSFLTTFAAGEVDTNFNVSVRRDGSYAYATAIQPDGKVLVGGLFTTANEAARSGLARFNIDGTVDTSFDVIDISGDLGQGGKVNAIALQSDGKVLIGGNFSYVNGVLRRTLARLNADGSLDTTFTNYGSNFGGEIYDMKVYPNNQFVIVGGISLNNGNNSRYNVIRFNADGSVDLTFQVDNSYFQTSAISIEPNGKVMIGGATYFRRVNLDGQTDTSFTPVSVTPGGSYSVGVKTIFAQPDGKYLIGGGFNQTNGFTTIYLSRINPDGSVDSTFNYNSFNGFINKIESAGQGKVYVGGNFSTINNISKLRLARLNADGTVDTTFTSPLPNSYLFYNSALAADGKVIVAGHLPTDETPIIRLNLDGSLDNTFTARIGRVGSVQKVFAQADGKIIVGVCSQKAMMPLKEILCALIPMAHLIRVFKQPLLVITLLQSHSSQTENC